MKLLVALVGSLVAVSRASRSSASHLEGVSARPARRPEVRGKRHTNNTSHMDLYAEGERHTNNTSRHTNNTSHMDHMDLYAEAAADVDQAGGAYRGTTPGRNRRLAAENPSDPSDDNRSKEQDEEEDDDDVDDMAEDLDDDEEDDEEDEDDEDDDGEESDYLHFMEGQDGWGDIENLWLTSW
eukprot:TRINITY_DN36912_c0_g1_i13.p1 TRINITY_DN36912_c0_g1~~TRINITY_DN36912_c0_g1_i13.p1  ORF type:complete len:182 (+),score=44.73 TRINITY_DN36912_c0_g1_i13:76-621(+)